MGCCTSSTSPSRCAQWFPRLAFGLVLVAYGVNHYRYIGDFVGMSKSVYPTVGILATIAGVLAYVVPALMIVGGLLFAVRQLCCISKMCILGSLSGIIGWASLAVLVGDGASGGAMMPMIQNASVLLVLYYMIKKSSCGPCSGPSTCGKDSSCKCGMSK